MNAADYDCIIVGGGFTGLSAAADLARNGARVLVLEKDAALGGLASSFDVGGHELEKFYHHWFTSDRHVGELATLIGAEDQIVTRATRTGMYYAGATFRLSTPLDLLQFDAIPFLDRVRTGLATLAVRGVKDWRALESMSAKAWLIKWFGQRAYDVLWSPLLVGKFGRYADDVSAVWIWNKLALRGGSRGKGGGEALAYFKGGFARLAREVGAYIERRGGEIRLRTSASAIHATAGGVHVETDAGAITARSVLVTTPLPQAADLLGGAAPTAYTQKLRAIDYLGNVCLILELDRSLGDLYWINVNDPSFPFVGIIEHTNFEPASAYGGRHIVYLSKYLPTDDPLYSMSADDMFAFAAPHIQRMFPQFEPAWVRQRHVWRAPYAQPVVVRRYSKLIPDTETPLPGVYLASMAQVYPEDRGTNYAVREGRKAAGLIRRHIAERRA
ncbi:MAG: NAD(P)/FAD-dependent oxidoreductase [Caulobacterales bacterium]|nr:NAD(P)/FAD-dependent oxidoreductase [Caulobacterales bacterium]